MQQKQIKKWLAHGGETDCILYTYADSSYYRPEVIVHNAPEPITNSSGETIHFNSLVNAKEGMKKLGFDSVILKLDLPYDEMLGEKVSANECFQEMKICL
ncbi:MULTISPECIES: DUF6482 family protein [unclassified Motilimonas]|uniref:DUF6482 family protein n=1 Tax=Motilimonas TaxID=1914248 RepID=UPI001E31AA72|nr:MULTISPECIES: DUF6482 family protein [unclassified Motilimonas]MCE0555916.1 hypothetical protein [Motilimonas sp. E26]MDO6527775.1 DUF6482 family protein [Motilimonas sp. 1_MG-2023]